MASKKKSPAKKTPKAPDTAESRISNAERTNEGVLLVGVGASAGGLEAFSQLLRSLPPEPGLALVLVQHLAPQHESSLAVLLSATTPLPVTQVTDDTAVEPNHVYIIPPNRVLIYDNGMLVLQPRPTDRTQYTPIDAFFRSLAKELGSEAVAVILSGTASDGVEGVHAIKAVGGTVIVQEPESAKHDGMPRAAMATGKVDLVLAPPALADELARMVHNRVRRSVRPQIAGDSLSLDAGHLEQIFALLRASSGVDFGQYKLPTVQRRIQRRMALNKVITVDHYLKVLRENPGELEQLYQDILIHVTRFFREPDSFSILASEVFPALLEARQGDSPLRIWVPACSTGEEPYSVAMALLESLDARGEVSPIQIFATDISETAIEQARAGVYAPSVTEDLSAERIRRFFTKTDGHFRINKEIRDLCVFARQDLTRDPPFSKLDLIVCRNVLIYLSQSVQSRLIGVFHYALKPTGFLMLGSAETIGTHAELFAVADKKHRVYRKKVAETASDMQFAVPPYPRSQLGRGVRSENEPRSSSSIQSEANRLVLERYAPAGVVVDEDLRIVQFRGQTGKFLEPAPGDASLNLLKMCREGLLHGLRTTIQTAKKKNSAARREGLRVKTNGDFINVTVEAVPLETPGDSRHFLILFQNVSPAEPAQGQVKGHHPKRAKKSVGLESDEDIERLQRELVASREYLQSIIQDLEATNEELQSANEEILSSNEELQSTNEELDTAKEELQSTNEELNTVNEELHGRNEELARINSDLVNVLNGVQIAIVIVASDLRIRRFTPMAERVLNLISGDIGRPISQIKPNINCPDLERLILQVIDTITVEQRDVQDMNGRTYSLTIRPYKNVDNRIDGAVLALFDIDAVRQHELEAQAAREYAEAVMAAVKHPLMILDDELRIRSVNPAFATLFEIPKRSAEGQFLLDLGNGPWSTPNVQSMLERVLPGNGEADSLQVSFRSDGEKTSQIRFTARKIGGTERRQPLILLEMEDVTDHT